MEEKNSGLFKFLSFMFWIGLASFLILLGLYFGGTVRAARLWDALSISFLLFIARIAYKGLRAEEDSREATGSAIIFIAALVTGFNFPVIRGLYYGLTGNDWIWLPVYWLLVFFPPFTIMTIIFCIIWGKRREDTRNDWTILSVFSAWFGFSLWITLVKGIFVGWRTLIIMTGAALFCLVWSLVIGDVIIFVGQKLNSFFSQLVSWIKEIISSSFRRAFLE